MSRFFAFLFVVVGSMMLVGGAAHAGPTSHPAKSAAAWGESLDDSLIEFYDREPGDPPVAPIVIPADVLSALHPAAKALLNEPIDRSLPYPLQVGVIRGRLQQAMILEMASAVRDNRVADAQAWRVQINLPRGVSATEGELLLENLASGSAQRASAVKALVREAITWQTARVRQLLAAASKSVEHADAPMPGRLVEQLGEAVTLADLPAPLAQEAGLPADGAWARAGSFNPQPILELQAIPWAHLGKPVRAFQMRIESHLPSLLSPAERARRERMLLKLVAIIPSEYHAGVRDGKVTVPLEYREAVSFTEQARQFVDELSPLWLSGDNGASLRQPLTKLDEALNKAQQQIADKVEPDELASTLKGAQSILEDSFNITLHRGGTTADIVDEVMLETRRLLGASLASANTGQWREAESQRLEAYTTYDPDLEARLMPRDPQLATDIEHLLLDGLDKPGVKALLDRRIAGPELEAAYARVYAALDRATALLKNGVSPTAAAVNAGSIVLREGLEGLLVIVAILASLRGEEHRRKRHLIWYGVLLSLGATAITVILSQTILTRLHYYGELIEAITSLLAIGVLLLITNWLFQQIYWRQWICTLKGHAAEDGAWHLITVGFLIGYREGFETVLFLQSMMLDVGGSPIAIGVAVGLVLLVGLGIAALVMGMKLPYYKLLLITAGMIGFVLVTFVGTGIRTMQTVGWLPVHKLVSDSWPAWVGQWLGVYNSMETIGGQVLAMIAVLGTWQVSRWKAHRMAANRARERVLAAASRQPAERELVAAEVPDERECQLDFNDPNAPCPLDGDECAAAHAGAGHQRLPYPNHEPVQVTVRAYPKATGASPV